MQLYQPCNPLHLGASLNLKVAMHHAVHQPCDRALPQLAVPSRLGYNLAALAISMVM